MSRTLSRIKNPDTAQHHWPALDYLAAEQYKIIQEDLRTASSGEEIGEVIYRAMIGLAEIGYNVGLEVGQKKEVPFFKCTRDHTE